MNISIDRLIKIEEEYLPDFEFKKELSSIELYGLEHILSVLLNEYEIELGCTNRDTHDFVDFYTTHQKNYLDVLDGRENYINIGDYYITSAYITTNNIVVFECIKVDENYAAIDKSKYYISLN